MSELFNTLKSSLPALVFFCVGAAFALFFLVLVFFYIAKEKKRKNAFDVTATVINILALCVTVLIGLCAVFYRFPVQKVSVLGEYAAVFDVFGLKFTVSGFGAVLKFICGGYGISLYSALLFSLVLFAVIHPLRVLRKNAAEAGAQTFSSLSEAETLASKADTELDFAETEDKAENGGDALIDELSEENIYDKIDEIVTRAKTEVSSSDDVSPFKIDESDVSDVLEMLSDETDETVSEPETEIGANAREDSENIVEREQAEEFVNDEEPTESEKFEEPNNATEEFEKREIREETEKEPKAGEAPPKAEYVIPVTVRTIVRHKAATETAENETPQEKKQNEIKSAQKEQKPKKTDTAAAREEIAAAAQKSDATLPPREVEAKHILALPVGRRYVVQNRRNVVNMFNDYLNSKEQDEKEKLANSLNTIILK